MHKLAVRRALISRPFSILLFSVSLFVEDEVEAFDPLKTIYDFIQFVDRVCVVGLQVSETTQCDRKLRLLSNGTSVRQTHYATCRT